MNFSVSPTDAPRGHCHPLWFKPGQYLFKGSCISTASLSLSSELLFQNADFCWYFLHRNLSRRIPFITKPNWPFCRGTYRVFAASVTRSEYPSGRTYVFKKGVQPLHTLLPFYSVRKLRRFGSFPFRFRPCTAVCFYVYSFRFRHLLLCAKE